MGAQREYVPGYHGLHDDTEEDVVGADWHQTAISELVFNLRDVALLEHLPWHVGNQLTLVAQKPDGTVWKPMPDVMVHSKAGSQARDIISARIDGPPALVIEVASPATWDYDVNSIEGKAAGYLALGVKDYLVFDPTTQLLGASCRAWTLRDETSQPWLPSALNRYECRALDVSFQPEGELLRVLNSAGQRVLFSYEKTRRLAELETPSL